MKGRVQEVNISSVSIACKHISNNDQNWVTSGFPLTHKENKQRKWKKAQVSSLSRQLTDGISVRLPRTVHKWKLIRENMYCSQIIQ